MERWQTARIESVDDRGRARIVVDPDPDHAWPDTGTAFLVRVRRPRNPKHHRLYWGMLSQVVDATGRWSSRDALHKWIKYQLNLYTVTAFDGGRVIVEWDSTDYMSMDQADFREFFDQAVAAICIETGVDPLALKPAATETAAPPPDEVRQTGDDHWWK